MCRRVSSSLARPVVPCVFLYLLDGPQDVQEPGPGDPVRRKIG